MPVDIASMHAPSNTTIDGLRDWLQCPHCASENVAIATPECDLVTVYCYDCEHIEHNADDYVIITSDIFEQ